MKMRKKMTRMKKRKILMKAKVKKRRTERVQKRASNPMTVRLMKTVQNRSVMTRTTKIAAEVAKPVVVVLDGAGAEVEAVEEVTLTVAKLTEMPPWPDL